MRIYKGWLFEDHFGHAHIEFEILGAFWIKHYPTLFEATEAAYRVGLLTLVQVRMLREADGPRWIELHPEGRIGEDVLKRAGFVLLKQS